MIKKILPILALAIITLTFTSPLRAEEVDLSNPVVYDEVILEDSQIDILEAPHVVNIEEDIEKEEVPRTLRDKLQDVYNLEIYKYDVPSHLFGEILTQHFKEDAIVSKIKYWGAINSNTRLEFKENGSLLGRYDFNAVNLGMDGTFKDGLGDFRLLLGINPNSERNIIQGLFLDAYVATNKIPHHRILVGNSRPMVGVEGGMSALTLPFFQRAQISRNFGAVRRLGARVIGDYSLIDYDLGVFSSDTYWQSFFPGAEFIGWVNFKPLGKTDGRYGKLKLGGGMEAGHRSNNYCVTGLYAGYEYKRFMANFEWANANGYNGPIGHSVNKHASGFYTTIGYMITKKLQILARYDEFVPDNHIKHNTKREYSVGLNYFIKGQALRLIFNYVFCQNDTSKDSHKIMLGTQIIL